MERFGFNQPFLVKKSPVVIVKTFLILQLTVIALFFLSGILIDYGEIYDQLPLVHSLSFHIAEAIGIFLMETLLIFYIFFRWYKESYDIKQDKVIYSRGIVFRRKTVIPIKNLGPISYRQGPLGKLTKYGNIELKERSSDKGFVMDHVPDPHAYVELLVHLKESAKDIREPSFSLEDLISGGEDEHLEFKTSFRWDARQNKVNKNLEKAVMKSIVAFMNSHGGRLIIGVDDSGNASGLAKDYYSLPKPNADGFQNHFTNVFHSMVGPEYRQFIKMNISKIGDKECCLIEVMPANKPAYLKMESDEEFYIRTGNGTTSLKLSETSSYIDSHWRAKLL